VLAYALPIVPAAIGVAFVARYAYMTSDTHDAGLAAAALYGMTAAAAFAGPAAALAVANAGRKGAAVLLGLLAFLAIVANWTNTLGAIAQRGAGTEAASIKAKADAADARSEIKRLEGELAKLGAFTPTDEAAVGAAKRAADAATTAKERECAGGEAKQRGKLCRDREADEQKAAEKLTAATTAKATTERANKLESELASERGKLGKAPTTPTTNAIGEVLGGFLSISAASATTAQQALISAIVELVIAAALAMPELLRPVQQPVAKREDAEVMTAPAVQASTAQMTETGSVRRFMLACIARAKGQTTMRTAAYRRYCRWCEDQRATPLAIPAFWAEFQPLCEKVGIKMRERDGKVQLVDIQLAA
jgi:hypothetical protein